MKVKLKAKVKENENQNRFQGLCHGQMNVKLKFEVTVKVEWK